MEEMTIQEEPGFFGKFARIFTRTEEVEEIPEATPVRGVKSANIAAINNYRYTVTVRRQVMSFDDAMAAANGLKRGEQQILNLSGTDPVTRQKIVDFMCGVNFSEEGTWEEVGDNIYLIVPPSAYVEVAPPTPRMTSFHN